MLSDFYFSDPVEMYSNIQYIWQAQMQCLSVTMETLFSFSFPINANDLKTGQKEAKGAWDRGK